jgi:hypothetical protein
MVPSLTGKFTEYSEDCFGKLKAKKHRGTGINIITDITAIST